MPTKNLKIGLPATLSGELSIQGKESFNGIKLWFKESEIKGGVKIAGSESKIIPELTCYDDRSSPELTKLNTVKLITQDEVDLLLGPYSSSLTLACIKAASRFKRVVWNHGGSSDDIHKYGYNRLISTITEAGKYYNGIIDFILKLNDHNSGISIVRKKASQFSKHVSEGARHYADTRGLRTKVFEFEGGTTSFKDVIDGIKEFNPDFIFCVGSATDDINFCRFLLDRSDIEYIFTATLAASINRFKSELGISSEYFVATSQWEPSINTRVDFGPDSKTFSQNFYDEYGYMPDYTAAQGYNICLIIEKLLEKKGIDEQQMMSEALVSRFNTFYGQFEVERSSGKQTGHEMIVVQWQSGEKKVIYPPEVSNSCFKSKIKRV